MTAAEFARKHGVPYQEVRQALRLTPTRQKESWALEFPEDELRQAVKAELKYKLEWHRERLNKIAGWMGNLG